MIQYVKGVENMFKNILDYNKRFVASKAFEAYETDRYPNKKLAIITCIDTRLMTLLPAALHLQNGDAKIIKTVGAYVNDPYGDTMRSLLIAIYKLRVEHVMLIAHSDCGFVQMRSEDIMQMMLAFGIQKQTLLHIQENEKDLHSWFRGFQDTHQAVKESTCLIRDHPLIPSTIDVHGYIIDSKSGELHFII